MAGRTTQQDAEEQLTRLEAAAERMAALDEEVTALKARLANDDLHAIHLGARRITEAFLRHAIAKQGCELPRNATIGPMVQTLREALGKTADTGIDPKFWRDIERISGVTNANAHSDLNDVYRRSSFHRTHRWEDVKDVLSAVTCVTELFVMHWPRPTCHPAGQHRARARLRIAPSPTRIISTWVTSPSRKPEGESTFVAGCRRARD